MKILLITRSLSSGGSSTGASSLRSALEATGISVVAADSHGGQAFHWTKIARFVERVVERTFYGQELHCLRVAPTTLSLKALVKEVRPDVVQLCDLSGNVIALQKLDEFDCPVVHRMSDFWPYFGPMHYAVAPDSGPPSARWLMNKTIFNGEITPSVRVAPSDWLASRIKTFEKQPSDIRVIRNAVAVPNNVSPRRKSQGLLRFGFIAHKLNHPRKGLAKLPPFLKAIRKLGINVSFTLFGRSASVDFFAKTNIDVRLNKPFHRSELPNVFRTIDILLCPSQSDNSPNVVTEALAQGCPVIAQAGTGMDSYVNESTGALIDFWNGGDDAIEAFLLACQRIMSDYDGYSMRAHAYAQEYLSYEVIGRAYFDLYSELLSGRSPTATHALYGDRIDRGD